LESVEATLSEAISTIKQQAITAQKQAEAYKETYCSPPVVINGVLALVGLGYLIFMGLQLSQIKKQTGIASDALILANRPRIKVRGFYVKADIDQDATGVKSWTMEVGYELVNHGGTKAIIIDSKHRLLMDPSHRPPTLRMPPDYGADQIIPGGTIINVGDTRQFVMRGTVSPEIQAELQPLVDQRQDAVMMCFKPYCIGFIAYKARIGNS